MLTSTEAYVSFSVNWFISEQVIAALVAVAAAFPAEERVRRSAVWAVQAAPSAVVRGAAATLTGPSGEL